MPGRVYEYFLSQFASAEGKKGGQFYTPRSVVQVLVEMLAPYRGRVYDPCCGSGGMFVQSEAFIAAHGGRIGDVSIYGQESNYTTWRLCKMNLAIRGIDGNIAHGDTFLNDRFPDLRADFILANPPFNLRDWGQDSLKNSPRWAFGTPPANNANFAWMQHMIHHLAPGGYAGIVLANGSMSSNTSGEGEIRKAIGEANLVDCMVALPGQLFYSTQIPACLWFLSKDREGRRGRTRDRRDEILFIDARQMGRMMDRTHRELTPEDIRKIADTYHAWRGGRSAGGGRSETLPPRYEDEPGFCKAAARKGIVERPRDRARRPAVQGRGRFRGLEAAVMVSDSHLGVGLNLVDRVIGRGVRPDHIGNRPVNRADAVLPRRELSVQEGGNGKHIRLVDCAPLPDVFLQRRHRAADVGFKVCNNRLVLPAAQFGNP